MILRRNEAPMKFENGYTECLGRRQLRKKMNNHKSSRENWKRFKNCPYFCQTRVFRDWNESPQSNQFKLPKHSKTKIWKNFLSVFRDWKVYPRESCELSCENLWVTLATGPSTCEQVAKKSRKHATEARDLTYPRLSRQNRAKEDFWNYQIF